MLDRLNQAGKLSEKYEIQPFKLTIDAEQGVHTVVDIGSDER